MISAIRSFPYVLYGEQEACNAHKVLSSLHIQCGIEEVCREYKSMKYKLLQRGFIQKSVWWNSRLGMNLIARLFLAADHSCTTFSALHIYSCSSCKFPRSGFSWSSGFWSQNYHVSLAFIETRDVSLPFAMSSSLATSPCSGSPL